ncbi:MarR family winged helix-turn-helix transcriptional regulator [Nocardioides mangrovicus]|uniref:MarR family winged helix-turn-helix transcriptional regulator n=1 Tax=Nocardioides mangrovicus TaxID=2478913 RepID=UPI001E30E88E|nr:MarR family winged helix-turn-helix transcriptional regulator [Nocardioides mangrovicus]
MSAVGQDRLRDLSSDLVIQVARLVRDVRRNSSDLPASATRLMSLIDELGPSTVGVLAERDRCSQPTMTGMVKGLVERGWVDRTPHPHDSRAQLVDLTDLGRTVLTDLRRRHSALIAERVLATGHTEQELEAAVRLLADLLPPHPDDTTQEGPA